MFLTAKPKGWCKRITLFCMSFLLVGLAYGQDMPANAKHIQLLAASCAACHGQQGNSAGVTPVLAGLSSDYFVSRMLAFRDGSQAATVMHHHAKGLSPEEIQQLAQYFAQQTRISSKALPQ